MAKKKAGKKSKKPGKLAGKWKSFYGKHHVIGVLLIAAGVWALIWLGQVSVERYNFYQAERKLDKLASVLQAKIGNDVKLKKERSCGYSSEKYGRGDRGCSVYYTGRLISPTTEQSTVIAEKWLDASVDTGEFNNRTVNINELPFNKKFEGLRPGSKTQKVSIFFNKASGDLVCSSTAIYTAYSQESKNLTDVEDSLDLLVGCNGAAKWEYFSVQD